MELINGNYSPTFTELTPVQLTDNTEVKVPFVSSYPPNAQQFSIKTEDSFSEYPTESYMEFNNTDELFGPNFTQSQFVQLQSIFRGLPKSMFIDAIKKTMRHVKYVWRRSEAVCLRS